MCRLLGISLACLCVCPFGSDSHSAIAYSPAVVTVPVVANPLVVVPVVVPATTFQFVPAAVATQTAIASSPAAATATAVGPAAGVGISGIAQAPGTPVAADPQPEVVAEQPASESFSDSPVRFTKSGLPIAPTVIGQPVQGGAAGSSVAVGTATPAGTASGAGNGAAGGAGNGSGVGTGVGTGAGIGWQKVLATKCASCHTGPGSSGNFQIFQSQGVLAPGMNDKFQLAYVSFLADFAEMPPKAKGNIQSPHALPNEEVLAIKNEVLRLRKAGK